MYNYFIKTNKKVYKHPKPMQWMSAEIFGEFLLDVKKSGEKYIKSWRSPVKKGKKK